MASTACLAVPASAAVVDLTTIVFDQIDTDLNPLNGLFGSGGVASTTFDRDANPGTANNITLSTTGTRPLVDLGGLEIGSVQSRLKGGASGAGLVTLITGAEGICAGGRGVLTQLDCAGPVKFDFGTGANAVSSVEIQFEANVDLLDAMEISFDYDVGGGVQTKSGTAFELLDLGLLNVISLGLGNYSGFYIGQEGIQSVAYSPNPLLGLTSVGGPVAHTLKFNEAAPPSAVPLPAAVFGLLAGLGALGVVGRRRGKTAA